MNSKRLSTRRLTRLKLLAAATTTVLLAAACSSSHTGGGDGKSTADAAGTSGTTGSATDKATDKSPIKLGIITDVDTPGTDHSDVLGAVKASIRAVNSAGGVNGHPLQLEFCNENLVPNTSQACVRKLISQHVVATVGNTIYAAEQFADQAFEQAGIAQIGNVADGVSEHDPNSYLLDGGQWFANAAHAYGATTFAGKRVGYVRIDLPFTSTWPAFYARACASLGCDIVSSAVVPAETTTDFGAIAAELMRGKPDVVIVNVGLGVIPLLKTMDQLGYTGKVIMQDANFTTKNFFAQPVAMQKQYILISAYPPAFATQDFPAIAQYDADMKAEKAAGDSAAPVDTSLSDSFATSGYLAVKVFAEVAAAAKAYDAAAFKKAIDSATDIDRFGLAKPWTPNASLLAALPRVSTDQAFFYTTAKGQQPVLLNKQAASVLSVVKAAYRS